MIKIHSQQDHMLNIVCLRALWVFRMSAVKSHNLSVSFKSDVIQTFRLALLMIQCAD